MGKVKIVSASAGSGKTYNLAYEYVRNVVDNPTLYRHILAVTFTNKATEEMKQRILSKINELATGASKDFILDLRRDLRLSDDVIERRAKEARSRILHDYNHFAVLTIDKFFQRIIRSFIKELGVDVNFNLELPTETLLSGATDRLIDDSVEDEALRDWLTAFVNERIDDNKKWNIKDDIQSLGEEVFKERFRTGDMNTSRASIETLVKNAVREGEKSKNIIMSAAKYALELLRDNGLTADDFSFKSSGVGGFIESNAAGELTAPGERVQKALNGGAWCPAKSDKRSVIETIENELHDRVAAIVDAYNDNIRSIHTANLLRRNYRSFALLGDLKKKIDALSAEDNIVHISEINAMLSQLIGENDAPFIFEKAGNYYSHYMIDEFQDTSVLQWRNFIPLLYNAASQSEQMPVMLVGDVKQSIYRWRGGDWKILARHAPSEFDETESMSLQTNYRSSETVVRFNNAIVGAVVAADNEHINGRLAEAASKGAVGAALCAELTDLAAKAYDDYLQEPKDNSGSGYATITYFKKGDDGAAAPPVIERIEELQSRGYRASDIAVLVRTNSQATQIANMLLEHKSANPESRYCYDVISQDALVIGKAPVCGFVMACMVLSANPEDSVNRAVYNHRLGFAFERELSAEELMFFAELRLQSPEEAFEAVVIKFSLGGDPHEVAYLQALHEQIISFTSTHIADIPLFAEWWRETGSTKSIAMPMGGNAITIDTIHRSKGLGYRVVLIPYCNWSMNTKSDSVVWAVSKNRRGNADETDRKEQISAFPIGYSSVMADSTFAENYYEEYVMSHIDNLNLFYVAVTRAKDELHIMMPEPPKTGVSETIARLIGRSVMVNGERADVGGYEGTVINLDNGDTLFEFGRPSEAENARKDDEQRVINIDFVSRPIGERAKISVASQRYIDDGAGDDRLSPRDYGILMHRVFEYARSYDEIYRNLSGLIENGELSADEADTLARKIESAFEDEGIAEWFSDEWDEVRNENDIIMPGESKYRPDRVMIRGRRAVVVDYKFGLKEDKAHLRQTWNYAAILFDMGYDSEGYVWYVGLGKVVKAII